MRTAEELRHKWLDVVGEVDKQDGKHYYVCPFCKSGASYFIEDDDVFHEKMPNYCPNCGNRMTP